MPIDLIDSDFVKLTENTDRLLANMRKSCTKASAEWKALAQGETVPLNVLTSAIDRWADRLTANMDWVIDLRANRLNPVNKAKLDVFFDKRSGGVTEIVTTTNSFRALAQQVKTAPKTTYAEVVTICDTIQVEVTPHIPLWNE